MISQSRNPPAHARRFLVATHRWGFRWASEGILAKSWTRVLTIERIISRSRPNALLRGGQRDASNQGGGQVNQISIIVLGSAMVCASASALAQDFTAGKTPAQLFSSDCAECHHSPNGLARNRDVRMLASFLREHYTTKSETAGALAVYVSAFAGGAPVVRNRGTGVAVPANSASERSQADRRSRSAGEANATADDATKPTEDSAGRHRRTTNLSGEGEKRWVRGDGDILRPPGSVGTTPSRPSAGDSARRDASDPISRLRAYLSSGLGSEEAAKTGSPKARKRHNRSDTAEPATPDVQATAKTSAAAPSPPATVDATVPAAPPEDDASTASGLPPVIPRPRLEQ